MILNPMQKKRLNNGSENGAEFLQRDRDINRDGQIEIEPEKV